MLAGSDAGGVILSRALVPVRCWRSFLSAPLIQGRPPVVLEPSMEEVVVGSVFSSLDTISTRYAARVKTRREKKVVAN